MSTKKSGESVQRWTAKRRANLVLSILKGEEIKKLKQKIGELVIDNAISTTKRPRSSERGDGRLREKGVPRVEGSTLPNASGARRMRTGRRQPTEGLLVNRLGELAVEFPTFGYRRLWAILRRRDGILVNRKVVYR